MLLLHHIVVVRYNIDLNMRVLLYNLDQDRDNDEHLDKLYPIVLILYNIKLDLHNKSPFHHFVLMLDCNNV
jgi:hypothetical protein